MQTKSKLFGLLVANVSKRMLRLAQPPVILLGLTLSFIGGIGFPTSSALGAQWISVGEAQGVSFYYDAESIRRDSTGALVAVLADWPTAQETPGGGEPFYSQIVRYHFRCSRQIIDYVTAASYYAGHRGTGAVLLTSNDRIDRNRSVQPGSVYGRIYCVICR